MTEPDALDWYLPLGEALDEARARAILARFGPEVKRIGQEFAERVRAEAPGRPVEGKVYGLETLLHAYRHPRGPELTGVALGHIAYEPSGGGIKRRADSAGLGERTDLRAGMMGAASTDYGLDRRDVVRRRLGFRLGRTHADRLSRERDNGQPVGRHAASSVLRPTRILARD
jgi:hypothetical protein